MEKNDIPSKKQVLLYLRKNSGCGLMIASKCLDKLLYMLDHMPPDVCDMYPEVEMKWVMKPSKRQHETD